MAKLFAVTIIVIAILSAIPIVRHTWHQPEDISTHGRQIDEQMSETMAEAGLAFLAAQIILAAFIWKFSNPKPGTKIRNFPGGAPAMVIAGFILVGSEVLALGAFGAKAWANVFLSPASANALPMQVQAGQFAFYFRYPGPDNTFGPIHPELISESTQNFFGLDTTHDQASKDDIVTAEMAIPVNREIHLFMRSKDVGHSFLFLSYESSRTSFPELIYRFISPRRKSASTRSSALSYVAWATTTCGRFLAFYRRPTTTTG